MAKIKNVSGEDRIVPGLGGRLVVAGAVVEVPEDEAKSYLCQTKVWATAEVKKAKASNDENKEG